VQRVFSIPLAILVQFKLIARVVLVPRRMVIATGTLAASEGDMNDGLAFFCHGLIPLVFDLSYDAGRDGLSTFTNCEAEAWIHGNRM